MAIVKPFKGLRTPNQEVCEELACLPYDVMNSEEAAQMAAGCFIFSKKIFFL